MVLRKQQRQNDCNEAFEKESEDGISITTAEILQKGGFAGAAYFTIISCVYSVIALLGNFGNRQNNILVLTIVLAGISMGIFQQLWFNYRPCILRLSYWKRYLDFNVCLFITLVILAYVGEWLPNILEAWISFVGVYLVILLVSTLFFNREFKQEQLAYQKAFEKYQEARRSQ